MHAGLENVAGGHVYDAPVDSRGSHIPVNLSAGLTTASAVGAEDHSFLYGCGDDDDHALLRDDDFRQGSRCSDGSSPRTLRLPRHRR